MKALQMFSVGMQTVSITFSSFLRVPPSISGMPWTERSRPSTTRWPARRRSSTYSSTPAGVPGTTMLHIRRRRSGKKTAARSVAEVVAARRACSVLAGGPALVGRLGQWVVAALWVGQQAALGEGVLTILVGVL